MAVLTRRKRAAKGLSAPDVSLEQNAESPKSKKEKSVDNKQTNTAYFRQAVSNFLYEPVHPVNLAVFRFFFFWSLRHYRPYDVPLKSGFPPEMRVPPPGYHSFFHLIPISPSLTQRLLPLFDWACNFAMLGFCYEPAAWIAALLSTYLFGIPQCFGKIDHNHHLIWFALVLAASPSAAHALSLDRLMARYFFGKTTYKLRASWIYGIPLKIVMLLMSVCYFFPGYYKIIHSGYDWVFGDALRNAMHTIWLDQRDDFKPLFALDHYPLLCRIGAVATIVFEFFYPLFLIHPTSRLAIAAIGMSFHIGVELFMAIQFRHLLWMYVVFIDWHWLFQIGSSIVQRIHTRMTIPAYNDSQHPKESLRLGVAIGATLLLANTVVGFTSVRHNSWPIGTYPTWSNKWPDSAWRVSVYYKNADEEERIPTSQLNELFHGRSDEWRAVQGKMTAWPISDEDVLKLCTSLREVLEPAVPALREEGSKMVAYKDERWADPQKHEGEPKQRFPFCTL